MSQRSAIETWSRSWHALERTPQLCTEVLRETLDGQLCRGLKTIARAKQNKKPTRQAESTLFHFLAGHAFTGKYSRQFHAEHASSAYECGLDPQTVHYVVSDCPPRSVSPRFDFDDRSSRLALSSVDPESNLREAPSRLWFSEIMSEIENLVQSCLRTAERTGIRPGLATFS